MPQALVTRLPALAAAALSIPLALGLAASPDSDCGPSGERAIAAAREMAEALRHATGIPGLAVAVGSADGIVWSQGFGLADLETPVPVTSATRFRAASVSKLLATATLVRLADRGVVDLDSPVGSYLGDLPPALRALTPRQLAGPLGGIRHYRREDFVPSPIDHRHFDSLREALALFVDDEPVAPPGEAYHYSTFGYTLLGAVIEAATGRPYGAVLEDEVLTPLAMSATTLDEPARILPGRTSHYDRDRQGTLVNAAHVDPSYKWPGGGVLSSPEDLVRFGLAHLGDGFLPAELRAQIFAPQKTNSGESTGVGLGWRIGEDWRGRRLHHHSGSMTGARSSLLLYPDDDLVVALASNLGGWPPLVETTLQMIAEPFLTVSDAERGVRCGGDLAALPEGVFHYTATLDGVPGDGLLLLAHRQQGPRGTLSVAAPLASVFATAGAPDHGALAIVRAGTVADRPYLVIASPLGLLSLPLEVTAEELHGRLETAGRSFEIRVRTGGSADEPDAGSANRGEVEAGEEKPLPAAGRHR